MISDSLEIGRSVIQKALRRGDLEMTRRAAWWLIQSGDFEWLRKRLAVLTFEECWTYGSVVTYEMDESIIVGHLLQLAGMVKNRNAAGLGSLAHRLSIGDDSVLTGGDVDQHIKSMALAIHEPIQFWKDTRDKCVTALQVAIIQRAFDSIESVEQPWDKAFIQAAAYLALTGQIPGTHISTQHVHSLFPLWIAIDMHTRVGTIAITEAARRINCDPAKALWIAFYFEGALCNEVAHSPWWELEKIWRMKQLGLTIDGAQGTWLRLRPLVIGLLETETKSLEERIHAVRLPAE